MKSYEDILEFYKIKNELIDLSYLTKTKEKFVDLKPFTKKEDLDKELNLLLELIDFYKYDDGFDIQLVKDIQKQLESLNILGSYLEAKDLLNIKISLEIYRKCKVRSKNVKDKYKRIYDLFDNNFDTKELENIISEIIDDNGDIKDEASISIRDIRKQKKIVVQNIKDKIESIFNDNEKSRAIAERIITTRNDRYVINVKTDFKGLIKGLELDRSSTGNSVYIEPLSIVSLNNKIKEYESKEREEIRRILIRISDYCRTKKDIIDYVFLVNQRIDFLNAKVQYALKNDCNVVKINQKAVLHLKDARHPLLDKNKVVPLSFSLDDKKRVMLITGPNTGGKTVTLKVAGLLSYMALSGLAIPASEKSEIGMFSNILADIGDEQSIEQNLSSFSSHVKSIAEIIKEANNRSLILLDELGSGTDPIEGSAFAMSIIDYLSSLNAFCIITTHYSEVKVYAYEHEHIKSASMEFDSNTLNPTYRLIEGIPGESNALIIARKYGISEEILNNAKSYISEDNQKVEQMLQAIKDKSAELDNKNLEIDRLKEELRLKEEELNFKIMKFEEEKSEILSKSMLEADNYLKNIQAKAKSLVDKISRENESKEDAKNVQRSINMLYNSVVEDKKKIKEEKKTNIKDIDFKVGDEVYVSSLNQNAKILKVVANKNSLQVQAGILKLLVPISEVKKIEKKNNSRPRGSISYVKSSSKAEIDVRGKFAEDAIHDIESFLDKSVLAGYNQVYIVHGKGTMALRKKIQEFLKNSAYVLEFKDAEQNEGGHGCTVVFLK